jgi:hypothetical protein
MAESIALKLAQWQMSRETLSSFILLEAWKEIDIWFEQDNRASSGSMGLAR